MPVEYTEPVLVPAFASGGSLSVVIEVADTAARLALSLAAVTGNTFKQLDDATTWMLKAGGDPAVSGDWVAIGTPTTSLAYSAITGKPATFPATAHTHPNADLTQLAASLAGKAAAAHTHPRADLPEIAASLAGKAAAAHTHANADLTELAASLAGKAAAVHTHAIADVTDLEAELAAVVPPHLELGSAPVNGVLAIPNFLETNLTGADNDLRFQQIGSGTIPTITLVKLGSFGTTAVTVVGTDITISLASSFTAIYLTAADVKALIEASGPASALVTVGFKSGNNGTGAIAPFGEVIDFGPTALAGTVAAITGTAGVPGQTASFPGDGLATCVNDSPNTWFIHLTPEGVMEP